MRSSVIKVIIPRHTEQEKLAHGLFADNLSPKPIIDHPCNKDSSRRHQFSWDLYRKLMEKKKKRSKYREHRERSKERKGLKEWMGPRFAKNQTSPVNTGLVWMGNL